MGSNRVEDETGERTAREEAISKETTNRSRTDASRVRGESRHLYTNREVGLYTVQVGR